MDNFTERFEIVYKKYADWGEQCGFRPSKLAFSRFLGVFQSSMQRWEKGKIPNPKELKLIHDKLGFAYDWLIAGEGEMYDLTAQKLAEKQAEIDRLRMQTVNEPVLATAAGQE